MSAGVCRTCGSTDVAEIGPLPDGTNFAGRDVTPPLPGGGLWRCRTCSFVFRHPLLTDADYRRLYRDGSAEVWEAEQARMDFRLIARELAASSGAEPLDVLDVGCYTGQLLASLPNRCRLFGVEPNAAAARIATQRGVSIVAESVVDLADIERQFDVITACDVIEHVPDPLTFLRQLSARLRADGRLIISTGDADSWLWRLAGANYWYCYFPEHISFVGRRWLRAMPERGGLSVRQLIPFNYGGSALRPAAARALVGALLYAASPAGYRSVRRLLRSETAGFAPPGSGATQDHLVCILRKS